MVLVAAKIAVFVDGFPILAVTTHLFGEYAQRTNYDGTAALLPSGR
jgi:hypothetical protein